MPSEDRSARRREFAELAGDGFLLTAGTVTVGLALSYGLAMWFGGTAFEFGTAFVMFASGAAGVATAWLLHGRRINGVAIAGGIAGWLAGALVIPLAAATSFLLGLPLRLVTENEAAGPLAVLVLISIGVVALIVWLLVDAVRDMARTRRAHFRLDVARVAATVAFAFLIAASVYLVFTQPGPEQGEAPIWAMAAGVTAAGMIAGARLVSVLWDRRQHPGSAASTGSV